MANIHIHGSGNANLHIGDGISSANLNTGNTTMPKYVGARAVVDRVEDGVRITLSDYMGTTQEIIAEAISDITTNEDGSLTFVLPDGREITTGSLKGVDGTDGVDGFSPSASVSKVGDTATITITDKTGTTTASVKDGSDGTNDYNDLINKPTIPSKTSDLTNDSSFITLSDVPEEVFIARYGHTSYADMLAAYNAGKVIFCKDTDENRFIPLTDLLPDSNGDGYYFEFYGLTSVNSAKRYYRHPNTWSKNLESTVFVTPSTANYNDLSNKPSINGVTLTGDKNSGNLDIFDVYWVTYNTSTSLEIDGNYLAGKLVCVDYSGFEYILTYRHSDTKHEFTCLNNKVCRHIVCENDVWSSPTTEFFTSDYSELSNKPSIAGVTLSGNKTTSDLGIAEVFYAQYGSTTSAQIANAMDAGKFPVVVYQGFAYVIFSYTYPTSFGFITITPGGAINRVYCENDVWVSDTANVILASQIGANSGVCPLNSSGKVDASYLPVYSGGVS